jgi:peroxiredoxin
MKELGTEQLCKGKKVVLFAVPGAFTPTCSMKHLPGFIERADEIKVGVDVWTAPRFAAQLQLTLFW